MQKSWLQNLRCFQKIPFSIFAEKKIFLTKEVCRRVLKFKSVTEGGEGEGREGGEGGDGGGGEGEGGISADDHCKASFPESEVRE